MENEIDIDLIKQFRLDGASDQEILDVLVSDGGGKLNVNNDVRRSFVGPSRLHYFRKTSSSRYR